MPVEHTLFFSVPSIQSVNTFISNFYIARDRGLNNFLINNSGEFVSDKYLVKIMSATSIIEAARFVTTFKKLALHFERTEVGDLFDVGCVFDKYENALYYAKAFDLPEARVCFMPQSTVTTKGT